MDVQDWLALLAILICLALSFFLSGSEAALTAFSRSRMLRMQKAGNPNAIIVNQLFDAPERVFGTFLIGKIAVNAAVAVLVAALMLKWFGWLGIVYAIIVTVITIAVFTTALPAAIAINAPERVALSVARPVQGGVRVLGPVLVAIQGIVRFFLERLGVRPAEGAPVLSVREELRSAIDRNGSAELRGRDMSWGMLDLRELEVSDVMIHRTEMITVCVDDPPEDVVKAILGLPVTRIPLWSRRPDNFVGILHVRDLLVAVQEARGQLSKIDIVSLARPPWFVPTVRPLLEQLKAFRRRKTPLALVVDEYGELMGLVTLEDILEEIVGDIPDERETHLPGLWPQPDGSVHVDGGVPIRDLNRAMDWNLPDEGATTIAGLVIHEAQSIPDVGQTFTFYGFRFGVLLKDRNRITSLRITPLTKMLSH